MLCAEACINAHCKYNPCLFCTSIFYYCILFHYAACTSLNHVSTPVPRDIRRYNHKTGEWAHFSRLTRFPERRWLSNFSFATDYSTSSSVAMGKPASSIAAPGAVLARSNTSAIEGGDANDAGEGDGDAGGNEDAAAAGEGEGKGAGWGMAASEQLRVEWGTDDAGEVLRAVAAEARAELSKLEAELQRTASKGKSSRGQGKGTSTGTGASAGADKGDLKSFEYLRWFAKPEEALLLQECIEKDIEGKPELELIRTNHYSSPKKINFSPEYASIFLEYFKNIKLHFLDTFLVIVS